MTTTPNDSLQRIANAGDLASVFRLLEQHGGFAHVDHWQQGEFHHHHVLRVDAAALNLPGPILIVSTTCNGAVKDILNLGEVPRRWAVWGWRVPENPEFEPDAVQILASSRTPVWFDPRRLLLPDTRSELLPEHRRRQLGGGWVTIDSAEE